MYIIFNMLDYFTKFFWKNFFFMVDQLNAILFYNAIDKVSKEIILHLHFFKNQTFGDDYIFHWEKTKQIVSGNLEGEKRGVTNKVIKQIVVLSSISKSGNFNDFFFYKKYIKAIANYYTEILTRSFSFGFYYLRGLFFILFIDACLTDDEPLWEPIE